MYQVLYCTTALFTFYFVHRVCRVLYCSIYYILFCVQGVPGTVLQHCLHFVCVQGVPGTVLQHCLHFVCVQGVSGTVLQYCLHFVCVQGVPGSVLQREEQITKLLGNLTNEEYIFLSFYKEKKFDKVRRTKFSKFSVNP